jgi:HD-GYP domain-containing protein (c-di-GMP phosphodiesterase class II)
MTMTESMQPIERILKAMNSTAACLRLYADDHPIVAQSLEATYRALAHLLASRAESTLLLIENEWVWNGRPLGPAAQRNGRLMKELAERGIESITFRRDLRREDFFAFLRDIARGPGDSMQSSATIKFGRLLLKTNGVLLPALTTQAEDRVDAFADVREKKAEHLQELYSQIARMKKIDIKGVDDVVSAFIQSFAYGVSPIRLLYGIRGADEYTYTHMVNVCILTMSQAESLGFKGRHLYDIGVASILHDAGKLFIPKDILNKPGRLTQEERTVVETHSARGANFILTQKGMPKLAVVSALEHHIRYDGTGYPSIAGGYRTHIVSQMITIADIFDAMRSRRSYKEPASMETIMGILNKEKGTTFNPMLVENFKRLLAQAGC